jgi:hypothetical protein
LVDASAAYNGPDGVDTITADTVKFPLLSSGSLPTDSFTNNIPSARDCGPGTAEVQRFAADSIYLPFGGERGTGGFLVCADRFVFSPRNAPGWCR